MKNQYVGDINDYRKYGLIKIISNVFNEKTLFVWMLTKDDNNKNDGNFIKYLDIPQKYRQYNTTLFDELKIIVENKTKNDNIENILLVENSRFFKKYKSFNKILNDKKEYRDKYFNDVYKLSKNYDLIFFDPDNGIEIKTCKRGNKNSSKYIFWEEAEKFYNMGKSILIYQHYPRIKREKFHIEIEEKCISKLIGPKVLLIKTPNTLFILIKKSKEGLNKQINILKDELNIWKGEIAIV